MRLGTQRLWDAWQTLDRCKLSGGYFVWKPVMHSGSRPEQKPKYVLCWLSRSELTGQTLLRSNIGPFSELTEHEIFRNLLLVRLETLKKRREREAGSELVSMMWCVFHCFHRLKRQGKQLPVGSVNELARAFAQEIANIFDEELREIQGNTRNQRKYPSGKNGLKYGEKAGQPVRIETSESDWRTTEARAARENEPIEVRTDVVVPVNGDSPYTVSTTVYPSYQPYRPDLAVKAHPGSEEALSVFSKPNGTAYQGDLFSRAFRQESIHAPEDQLMANRLIDADVDLVKRILDHLHRSSSAEDQRLREICMKLLEEPWLLKQTRKKWTPEVTLIAELLCTSPRKVQRALKQIVLRNGDTQTPLAKKMRMSSLAEERDKAITQGIHGAPPMVANGTKKEGGQ